MRLPDPAAYLHSDGYWSADMDNEAGRAANAQVSYVGGPKLGMYSRDQLVALLTKQEVVMKQAFDALNTCTEEHWGTRFKSKDYNETLVASAKKKLGRILK